MVFVIMELVCVKATNGEENIVRKESVQIYAQEMDNAKKMANVHVKQDFLVKIVQLDSVQIIAIKKENVKRVNANVKKVSQVLIVLKKYVLKIALEMVNV
jgi:hypothetical protein